MNILTRIIAFVLGKELVWLTDFEDDEYLTWVRRAGPHAVACIHPVTRVGLVILQEDFTCISVPGRASSHIRKWRIA